MELIIAIITFGASGAVPFYVKVKESKDSQNKIYNTQGLRIILCISILLIFGLVMLYCGNNIFAYILESKLFPFYRCIFSSWNFIFLCILGIVFLIIILIGELYFINKNFLSPLNILMNIYTAFQLWGLIWIGYFVSTFATTNFQVESDLLFIIFTGIFLLVALSVSFLASIVLLMTLLFLAILLYEKTLK